jgi:NAD(P)H dehydrogenase (quinone)
MILVTGASGNYGKATIDFLLKKGISANGRRPESKRN